MSLQGLLLSKKEQFLVLAVTIGSILEWHEVFLFVYWAPLISEMALYTTIPLINFINTLFLFLTAIIARPIGGVVFGYIGDRFGRKIALILSIILISLPSILTWFVSVFFSWGIFAVVMYGMLRFIQGIPAGGEVPGVICYLAESVPSARKKYIISYTFVGTQIGQISSMIECLLLKKYLSPEDLWQWGWKASFLAGGLLGILGFFLRNQLAESPAFARIKHQALAKKSLISCCTIYRGRIGMALGLSFFEVAGFYLCTVFPYEHFSHIFSISENENILINIYFLGLATIILPFLGYAGNFINIKNLLIISTLIIMLLSYPLYYTISHSWLLPTLILCTGMIFCFCVSFTFLPWMLSQLFPTEVRFTGIGLSFNMCDSLVAGVSPLLTYILFKFFGTPALFLFSIPLLGLLFLYTLHLFEKPTFQKY